MTVNGSSFSSQPQYSSPNWRIPSAANGYGQSMPSYASPQFDLGAPSTQRLMEPPRLPSGSEYGSGGGAPRDFSSIFPSENPHPVGSSSLAGRVDYSRSGGLSVLSGLTSSLVSSPRISVPFDPLGKPVGGSFQGVGTAGLSSQLLPSQLSVPRTFSGSVAPKQPPGMERFAVPEGTLKKTDVFGAGSQLEHFLKPKEPSRAFEGFSFASCSLAGRMEAKSGVPLVIDFKKSVLVIDFSPPAAPLLSLGRTFVNLGDRGFLEDATQAMARRTDGKWKENMNSISRQVLGSSFSPSRSLPIPADRVLYSADQMQRFLASRPMVSVSFRDGTERSGGLVAFNPQTAFVIDPKVFERVLEKKVATALEIPQRQVADHVKSATKGVLHGSVDFLAGNVQGTQSILTYIGLEHLDLSPDERFGSLRAFEGIQERQKQTLDRAVMQVLSVDPSDPVYQMSRLVTGVGLDVASLAVGGYGAVKGGVRLCQSFRSPTAITLAKLANGTLRTQAGVGVGGLEYDFWSSKHYDVRLLNGAHAMKLDRPYMKSPLTVREIVKSGPPIPDPRKELGLVAWKVPGSTRGGNGTWELVVHPEDGIIYHFLFAGDK